MNEIQMRVLVVDDHALFRDGIVSLLTASGFEIVAQVGDGVTAMQEMARLKPNLVLLDINMPEMSGLDVLVQIRQEYPETQVVMLTASESDEHLLAAIRSGAQGYLLKNLDAKGLLASINGLKKGEAAISRKLTAKLINRLAQTEEAAQTEASVEPESEITKREQELLVYIADGLTNKAIANELDISENTVKYHLKNILRKMNVQNRAEAVAYAVRSGLISDKDTTA
jgi:two-component system nitrate/nitrite response regulator NarL